MGIISRLLPAVVIVASLITSSVSTATALEPLEYSRAQSATLRDVLAKLQSRHYRNMRVDDALSTSFLDNYLDSLDPTRMFFYDKDIQSFEKHRLKFDDYFRAGNLKPGYDIYELYRQRVASRMESILELLSDPAVKFNYTLDEKVLIERDKQPWPSTLNEADKLWFKRVKLSLLNLKMAGKEAEEAKEVVLKRYKRQLKRIRQQDSADAFEALVNSLTVLYDPHTNYWSPRTSENFDINMRLSLEGIGAVLQSEDEHTKVVRLVAGGPADKHGQLKPSDRITGVAQGEKGEVVDVVGWRLEEVVELIRGPQNTVVRLQVLPPEASIDGKAKTITINRGRVKLEDQAARKEVFDMVSGPDLYKIGVIDLPTFYIDFDGLNKGDLNYKSSTRDVRRLVEELKRENVDGIILDLRNNGGGSLREATQLTDLFIDPGPVVQIRNTNGQINRHHRARSKAIYRGPLIVMVNRLSASASEIFAGAIQDYDRGIIVGSQTFGKGTVQSVTPLLEGRLKITESKFYRVSGESTQHQGIIPDISYPLLIDAEEVGESVYDNALPWDRIHSVPHAEYFNFSTILPVVRNLHDQRVKEDPDYLYLLDQIDLMKKNKSRKTISLNEDFRVKEKESLELQAMSIDNKRRKAKSLPEYKTLEEYRKSELKDEDEEETAATEAEPEIDVNGDALLLETGSILADVIRLTSKPSVQQASSF